MGDFPRFDGVDGQVVVAASHLTDRQKKQQPEWLWFNYADETRSFGRWANGDQAPYIRADIALATIARLKAERDAAVAGEAVLRTLLEPFAQAAIHMRKFKDDRGLWEVAMTTWSNRTLVNLKVGMFRRAEEAFAHDGAPEGKAEDAGGVDG